jgi:hypothetical protein
MRRLWIYFDSIEGRAWLRYARCLLAQGLGQAIMWIVLLGAAGYVAYKATKCQEGQVCVDALTLKRP